MAYIRSKTIKGQRYFYLVEGFRVGGKVKQRVLEYLGPQDPSVAMRKALKDKYRKPRREKLSDPPEPINQTEQRLRDGAYAAFKFFGLPVRHNLRSGKVAGAVIVVRRKPVRVSFEKSPTTDTVLHELGHVIDFELERRSRKRRWYPLEIFRNWFGDHADESALQSESLALAELKYPVEGGIRRMLADQLYEQGTLCGDKQSQLNKLNEYFDEYAATPSEGFANAFALLMLDPDRARLVAPEHCQMIDGMISDEPDLHALIEAMQ